MNSLGAGGEKKPYLVNGANALTFCLMVVSCSFSRVIVRLVGIKWALVFGTVGYAPYAAGLYTNNRFGDEWFVLFGAALCGVSAGVFWMAEAAIALSYPEPNNQGRFLGLWLSFRVGGQILGGVSCSDGLFLPGILIKADSALLSGDQSWCQRKEQSGGEGIVQSLSGLHSFTSTRSVRGSACEQAIPSPAQRRCPSRHEHQEREFERVAAYSETPFQQGVPPHRPPDRPRCLHGSRHVYIRVALVQRSRSSVRLIPLRNRGCRCWQSSRSIS